MINEAYDHPRHAIGAQSDQSKPGRPHDRNKFQTSDSKFHTGTGKIRPVFQRTKRKNILSFPSGNNISQNEYKGKLSGFNKQQI